MSTTDLHSSPSHPTPDPAAQGSGSTPAGPRKQRFHLSFSTQVLIGLALGIVLGLIAVRLGPAGHAADGTVVPNWLTATLRMIGSIFVTLLKAVVPPLIFLAIVSSIAHLREVANATRLAVQTLIWFAITALIAVVIGMGIGIFTAPGTRTSVAASAAKASSTQGTWLDFLNGLVPQNFLGLEISTHGSSTSLSFNALQILVIAIVVGAAVLRAGAKAEPFLAVVNSAFKVVQRVLWWIIRLAPIGTVGLLGNAVASYGWGAVGSLGVFVLDVIVGCLVVGFVVYPVLLRTHGLSVGAFFRGVWPATQLGFVSRSSLGTMPVTREVTVKNLGVPSSYASFAVPLASTTKMDGCAAIYPALASIFVANFFHVQLNLADYLLIALVAVLGSAATAGMTGATVMLTLTLSTLGLPLEGVGLLMAIDPIIDMVRTALNVTGQALVPVIVAKREGILDRTVYDAPKEELALATA
ncbi:dicarboxylate/amino acid:cation symporter [Raineyella fluvialis]|uniref:Cation:dicarboxylase symporter family transporter n=1 Tax=Raineyella fluvialis TaxID=2662261 RepID=A0A5Q2FBE3_9ACTN|nr:dicarboxylate/amino acid:cation symporter [Raineyella fluvialis]QGF23721.1 cation:dicarboxylase symporter family transporter [Raineyella fluvialis]